MTASWVAFAFVLVIGTTLVVCGVVLASSCAAEALKQAAANDLAARRLQLQAETLRADYEIRLLAQRTADAIRNRGGRS